jgi:hypothetical protein
MLLNDAHIDLSLNAVNWNRDLTRPIADIRRSEQGLAGQAARRQHDRRPAKAAGHSQIARLFDADIDADIEGIMHGNWLRIFKRALPA